MMICWGSASGERLQRRRGPICFRLLPNSLAHTIARDLAVISREDFDLASLIAPLEDD